MAYTDAASPAAHTLYRRYLGTQDPPYCNNYSYPVLWTATSSDLGSASWSNKQEVTLAYDQGFFNVRYGPNHPAIAQTGSGTVYLGYTFFYMYWDRYGYYRTSTDSRATWSSETVYAYEPTRGTQGSQGVTVQNVYLAVDNNGSIRSFWDQSTADGWSSNPDNYPTQLFRRDLPSGAIIPVSAVKEALSQCSVCVPWAAFGADPVNLTTGNFTLPETDIAIPARGPGLALDDFDIYAAAGGRNLAVDRSFAVTVTDGILNVTFGRVTDNPMVSGIEVAWAGASPATPTVTYTYRGDGLRSTKTVAGSTITYTWDINAGLPVVLQDGSEIYVYGLGGLISQTDGSGNQSYFLGNGLGSTEALTDGSGNIAGTYKYDIFGAVRASTGSGSAEYRFTGQQDDAMLGCTELGHCEPPAGLK